MKKLIVFILFTFVAFENLNASTLDGVLGLKFGCSREEVKQIMLNKPDFQLEKSINSKDELVYSAGIFSGRDVHSLILKFTDDKLYLVIITIKPILESLLIDTYKAMKKEISEKYFNPNDELEDYDFPKRNYK